MGLYADLEIENGEVLEVIDDTGINEGKLIAALLCIYEYYILNGKNSKEYDWFALFESKSNVDMRILTHIMYAYDDGQYEEELNKYVADLWDKDPVSKEESTTRIRKKDRWGNIEEVITAVNEIVRILPTMEEVDYYYVKEDTYPAFISLQAVLQRALSEGAKRVRLHFE